MNSMRNRSTWTMLTVMVDAGARNERHGLEWLDCRNMEPLHDVPFKRSRA